MPLAFKSLSYILPSRSESGQDMAEYGLLLFLIALAVIVVALLVGNEILAIWNWILSNWP